jgi:N6-adenosine-specific RNA methylase IME4
MKYGLIMVDPPWDFSNWSAKGERKNAKHHYSCMSLDDIKALPVNQLASGDCCLFLWATWPLLDKSIEVMRAWGFDYRSGGAWHKKTKHGKTAFGTGYRVRCASEPFLLGFVGNPQNSRSERNLIEGEVREHSRKPDEAYAWCERYLPDVWRAELFSRVNRPGWETWGNEAGKFDQEAASMSWNTPSATSEQMDYL